MTNQERAVEISNTIISQLGGNKFKAMTGAKNFSYKIEENFNTTLTFKIGQNSKRVNHVKITLNASDLYDVQFLYCSVKGIKVLSSLEGVYAEDLRDIFETNTGLYTSL